MDVSENSGFSPKSSIWIGFSIIFTIHFWGYPYFWKHPHMIMVMEPKYLAEEVIVHLNHSLTRWWDPYGIGFWLNIWNHLSNPSMWGNLHTVHPSRLFFYRLVFIGDSRPIHRQDLMLMRLSGFSKCQLFLTWSMMTLWYVSSWYSWRFRNPANSPVEVGSCFPFIYRVNCTSQVVVWDFWTINSMFWYRKNWNPFQKGTHIFKLWILKCQEKKHLKSILGGCHLVDLTHSLSNWATTKLLLLSFVLVGQ